MVDPMSRWILPPSSYVLALGWVLLHCGRYSYDPLDRDTSVIEDTTVRIDQGGEVVEPMDVPVDVPTDISVDVPAICPEPMSNPDYCNGFPALGSVPVLDGEIDCALTLAPVVSARWTGPGVLPSDISAQYAAAWYPNGIYVYIDVTDPTREPAPDPNNPYCGDGVEIHLDNDGLFSSAPRYDNPGTIQLVAMAPMNDTESRSVGSMYRDTNRLGDWNPTRFATYPRPGGYRLEAMVTAEDLGLTTWDLMVAGRIGFDLSINVSGTPSGCGTRLGQYFLRIYTAGSAPCRGEPHCDVRAFCTPELISMGHSG
jgi:hypothetical protein